ncbi:MAG: ribonuclease P protein component [Firmicutes bacterium]|nr:ribonuclease P protein component [Bacillota bacterium]
MLSKQYRLKKRKSFNYIYKKGKHVGNETLALVFVAAKMKHIKIGFSVSKKVGNSVTRHKATRKMRAACRPLVPMIKENHSIIFVAKEGVEKKHVTEITQAMANTLRRAGLMS